MSSQSGDGHPYYPLDAVISDYLPNEWSVPALLVTFATACTAIFSITYALLKILQPQIAPSERLTIMWFVLCR